MKCKTASASILLLLYHYLDWSSMSVRGATVTPEERKKLISMLKTVRGKELAPLNVSASKLSTDELRKLTGFKNDCDQVINDLETTATAPPETGAEGAEPGAGATEPATRPTFAGYGEPPRKPEEVEPSGPKGAEPSDLGYPEPREPEEVEPSGPEEVGPSGPGYPEPREPEEVESSESTSSESEVYYREEPGKPGPREPSGIEYREEPGRPGPREPSGIEYRDEPSEFESTSSELSEFEDIELSEPGNVEPEPSGAGYPEPSGAEGVKPRKPEEFEPSMAEPAPSTPAAAPERPDKAKLNLSFERVLTALRILSDGMEEFDAYTGGMKGRFGTSDAAIKPSKREFSEKERRGLESLKTDTIDKLVDDAKGDTELVGMIKDLSSTITDVEELDNSISKAEAIQRYIANLK